MVQIIGFMVGLYIIVRMLSFITREGTRSENKVVKVSAMIVLIITTLLLLMLLTTPAKV